MQRKIIFIIGMVFLSVISNFQASSFIITDYSESDQGYSDLCANYIYNIQFPEVGMYEVILATTDNNIIRKTVAQSGTNASITFPENVDTISIIIFTYTDDGEKQFYSSQDVSIQSCELDEIQAEYSEEAEEFATDEVPMTVAYNEGSDTLELQSTDSAADLKVVYQFLNNEAATEIVFSELVEPTDNIIELNGENIVQISTTYVNDDGKTEESYYEINLFEDTDTIIFRKVSNFDLKIIEEMEIISKAEISKITTAVLINICLLIIAIIWKKKRRDSV